MKHWAGRFLAKIDFSGPYPEYRPDLDRCWIWKGSLLYGYAHFNADGQIGPGHRAAYELFIGPIPGGLHIDHLCRVRACVNPHHREPVTIGENNRRSMEARDNHCPNGHEYTPENTYHPLKKGGRMCRMCHRLSMRRRAERLRAQAMNT